MSVFADDLETAINTEFELTTNFSALNKEEINKYYYKYLQQHFKIKINNKPKSYKFLGKEYEQNIVYFYMETIEADYIKSIEFKNNVLTAIFPDQQNLIKVTINGKNKSLLLTKEKDNGLLNFN